MVQDRPARIERRLSAILAADVAGYSRLMHHDEESTHAKLTVLLMEAVHPAIAEHQGRIVKNTGDGFLAEFPSAVEAVRAAVQFQTRIEELTISEMEDTRIALRVGINIGDVIVEPHDIFGDGVNIAARLESISEPGGICISSSVYEHVLGKVHVELRDLGDQNFKNITRPVRTYAVGSRKAGASTQVARAKPDVLSPPRLSIVVLPFNNLSGDPDQDHFVDGVTETLTTDLSRISGSLVIGRHTAFTFKGKSIDLRKVGRELNVRYALEGSVQRSGNRLRINAQLVDASSGKHLWAERFDKPMSDLFDLQDEIVSRLANTLNAELIAAEARRAEGSLHPDALDLYFQGMARLNRGLTPSHITEARMFFKRALEIDPENVDALAGIAWVDLGSAGLLVVDDFEARLFAAEAAVAKALSLAPRHPLARLCLAMVYSITDVAKCIAECEHALALDCNLAEAHAFMGAAKTVLGRAVETEAHVQHALRLSPRDEAAHRWMSSVGLAKLHLQEYEEAAKWFDGALKRNPNSPFAKFFLATALAYLGREDQARSAAKEGLALDPAFTIRRFKFHPLRGSTSFIEGSKRIVRGLRMAGVPEG